MAGVESAVAVLPDRRSSAPRVPRVDVAAAERAARDLLAALGADLEREALAKTPARVARSFAEMLDRPPLEATTFPNDEGYNELVVVSKLPFHSVCEHHLLPFYGVAHLGYPPDERILGLSELPRVLDFFARDLQIQERLTVQVADRLEEWLRPKGVGVVLEAEHLCMAARGVEKAGARTVTSALRGKVRDDGRTGQEFLDLTRRG